VHLTKEHVFGYKYIGIRMRHEFFDAVLTKKETVDYVIANLKNANFDPNYLRLFKAINNLLANLLL
jgi:hypothetical protein